MPTARYATLTAARAVQAETDPHALVLLVLRYEQRDDPGKVRAVSCATPRLRSPASGKVPPSASSPFPAEAFLTPRIVPFGGARQSRMVSDLVVARPRKRDRASHRPERPPTFV